jgi:hypothetical protein
MTPPIQTSFNQFKGFFPFWRAEPHREPLRNSPGIRVLGGWGRDASFEGADPANDQDQFDGAPLEELAIGPIRPPFALTSRKSSRP